MSIGSRLKEARLRRGLTQEDLARAIGVTKGAIGNYETGVSSPKESVLIKLMSALGIDANYLYQDYVDFSDDNDQDIIAQITQSLQHNPKLGLLFDRSRKMSERDLDAVLGIVEAILKERDDD